METLNKQIDRFLEYMRSEKNCSSLTLKSYREDLAQFGLFLSGRKEGPAAHAGQVDHVMIREFLSQLMSRAYSRKSVQRKLAAVKSFFKFLYLRRMIGANPADLVSSPRLGRNLPRFLYPDEINRMLDSLDADSFEDRRNKALIEVLFSTGVRISELVGMNAEGIDPGTGMVKVRGKGNKERIVILGSRGLESLKKYLLKRSLFLQGKEGEEALFINTRGGRLTDRGVRHILKELVRKIALDKKVSPHTIRHTFATTMLNNGCDIRVVQELLGHVNLSTTEIYTHIMKNKLRDVYEQCHPHA